MDAVGRAAGGAAYEALGDLYDAWCAEVAEDLPFYLRVVAAHASSLERSSLDVLELGVGSGRIAVPVAAAGHRVTGVDLSRSQLVRYAERVAAAGVEDRSVLRQGDMLHVLGQLEPESLDLVLVPFRGMLHATADRDAIFAAAHACLRPGGVLAFDVFHPRAVQVESTHGRWLHRRQARTASGRWRFQERARYLPEQAAEPGGLALEVDVRCTWSPTRRQARERGASLVAEPAAGAPREQSACLRLQLVPAERWAASLEAAGFVVDGAYGWFDARPLHGDDDDSVWVARRA